MHSYLIDLLQCPACHGTLDWQVAESDATHIETAEARCASCGAVYQVREGIASFLTPELPRDDLWEKVDSELTYYLKNNPSDEALLMLSPLEALNPADQAYRAIVLDEREDFAAADQANQNAEAGLYTDAYLACQSNQIQFVLERVAQGSGPVVDLASGRGLLVEKMARFTTRPVVATNFSPRALRRARKRFQFLGLDERISLLAFDARRTPFKDQAVQTLTTFLGLPNIVEPVVLLAELRRICSGELLAAHFFFPNDDQPNLEYLYAADLQDLLLKEPALTAFVQSGWQVETANVCSALARPTPMSEILMGARVDGLPVADTTLEWCTVIAH